MSAAEEDQQGADQRQGHQGPTVHGAQPAHLLASVVVLLRALLSIALTEWPKTQVRLMQFAYDHAFRNYCAALDRPHRRSVCPIQTFSGPWHLVVAMPCDVCLLVDSQRNAHRVSSSVCQFNSTKSTQVGLGKDTKATFTLGFTKSNELFVGRLASAPPAAVFWTPLLRVSGAFPRSAPSAAQCNPLALIS